MIKNIDLNHVEKYLFELQDYAFRVQENKKAGLPSVPIDLLLGLLENHINFVRATNDAIEECKIEIKNKDNSINNLLDLFNKERVLEEI